MADDLPALAWPREATPDGVRGARADLPALAAQCPAGTPGDWPAARWLGGSEVARLARMPVRKRQIEWLGGRIAARLAACAWFDEPAGDAAPRPGDAELVIAHDQHGRPLLRAAGLRLSISHSRREAVAVVSRQPVGIDTEQFDSLAATSMDELLRQDELAVVVRRLGCAPREARTVLWCLKEALYKVIGERGFAAFAAGLRLRDWNEADQPLWRSPSGQAVAGAANAWRVGCRLDAESACVLVLPAAARGPGH